MENSFVNFRTIADKLSMNFNLSEEHRLCLSNFFMFLHHQNIHPEPIPYGLLVEYVDLSDVYQFIETLEAIFAQDDTLSSYRLITATEDNLPKINWSKHSDHHNILVVKDFLPSGSVEEMTKAFEATPLVVKIVFVSGDVLLERIAKDDHFFYRVLPRHIRLRNTSDEPITDRAIHMLEAEFPNLTTSFREELRFYIETIYDTADFKEDAFLNDLHLRISRTMQDQLGVETYRQGTPVDETFVPYSSKVTARRMQMESAASTEQIQSTAGTTNSDDTVFYPNMPSGYSVVTTTDSREAVILLFLSIYKKGLSQNYHPATNEKDVFEGYSTVDAPLQYLMKQINSNGQRLKKILCFATKEVQENIIDNHGTTTLSRFYTLVDKCYSCFFGHNCTPEELDSLIYALPYQEADETTANSIFRDITNALGSTPFDVYIDFTGGLRDGIFFMTTALRFLEVSGHNCKEIIYSKLGTSTIYQINYIYDMFQMINGAEEFATYAQVKQFGSLFAEIDNIKIKKMMTALSRFTETIHLNQVDNVEQAAHAVNAAFQEFDDSNCDTLNSTMLHHLLPVMRKKLQLDQLIQNDTLSYPALIRWCAEQGLIEQALTLYTEKIPYYYKANNLFDKNVLDWDIPVIDNRKKNNFNGKYDDDKGVSDWNKMNEHQKAAESFYQGLRSKLSDLFPSENYQSQFKVAKSLYHNHSEITDKNDLAIAILYYSNAKQLRNRINHAGEALKPYKREFYTDSAGITHDFIVEENIDSISAFLKRALDFSEYIVQERMLLSADTPLFRVSKRITLLNNTGSDIPSSYYVLCQISSSKLEKLCNNSDLEPTVPIAETKYYGLFTKDNLSILKSFMKGNDNYEKAVALIKDCMHAIEAQCEDNSMVLLDEQLWQIIEENNRVDQFTELLTQKACGLRLLRKDDSRGWQLLPT